MASQSRDSVKTSTCYIMSTQPENITERTNRQETQFEETEGALLSVMVEMLELPQQEYKKDLIMLRAAMDKDDSMQYQVRNIKREKGILRKNKQKCQG